jgi:hypothetical protein
MMIIIKKKHGNIISGLEIANANRLDSIQGFDTIFPDDFSWNGKILSEPVAKLSYVEAEFCTLAISAASRRRKKKAAKLLDRIANLDRRFINYVPGCNRLYHHGNWRIRNLPPKQKPYYPEYDYGYVENAGGLLSFLKEEGIDEFDFIIDSHYVIIDDRDGKLWNAMKNSGIIKLEEIDFERELLPNLKQ